jgi:hypothetical protein
VGGLLRAVIGGRKKTEDSDQWVSWSVRWLGNQVVNSFSLEDV